MQDTKIKAIVIGGGIAGCSTAYALAKRGLAVTVIDRHQTIAQGASGNPVAMLYPKFNTGLSMLSTMAMRGVAFTLTLLKQLQTNHEMYNICGQLQLAFNLREQEKQNRLLRVPDQTQYFQMLTASDASEKANLALRYGGLYFPESGWVKPKAFCVALLNSKLITSITSTQVIQINNMDGQWQVLLENQPMLEADIVVICNANDIHQFDQCKNIPITPVRGQVNFFAANPISQRIKTVICSDHYLSPVVDGYNSIGTSYAPNNLNSALSSQDTLANMAALKKISPSLFDSITLSEVTGRVAWRSATRDYFPLAGALIDEIALRKNPPRYNDTPSKLPWLKGLYVNAGHGSKGMITAPMCGELIANLINKEPLLIDHVIASKLNPSRFLLKGLGLKKIAQHLY